MRVLVIGAGATGGLFGARLIQAGRDVTLLVRPNRAKALRERGLRITGCGEDTVLAPKLLVTGEVTERFDIVLVTVKATGLDQAIEDFAPAVGPTTLVLPFLNGMRHLDTLDKRFGADRVLGGVARVLTTIDTNGDILRVGDMEGMAYGARAGTAPVTLDELDETLSTAFPEALSKDIDGDMWAKWMFIASLGAMTCLMRATVGEIVAVPGGEQLATALIDECASIAAAAGHPLSEQGLAKARAMATQQGSPGVTSMQRDLLAGHPTEVEHLLGDLTARARQFEVAVPLLDLATMHLRVHENRVASR
ncbi:ketopantoate reductase family protein [Streptomyces canus]|uniref:ketopantoate reductase family protein n=1 Tax=Streptomyces canus TaxID=58343 RepID=UPI0036966E63